MLKNTFTYVLASLSLVCWLFPLMGYIVAISAITKAHYCQEKAAMVMGIIGLCLTVTHSIFAVLVLVYY